MGVKREGDKSPPSSAVDKTVWNYIATFPSWIGMRDRSSINIEFPLIPLATQESDARDGSYVPNDKGACSVMC
jgi:hypothetical protein